MNSRQVDLWQKSLTIDRPLTPVLPQVAHSVELSPTHKIAVHEVDGRWDTDSTVVFALPWSSFGERRDVRYQTEYIAASLGVRALVLDTPGIAPHVGTFPQRVRKNIASGYLDPVADMQWEALQTIDPDLKEFALVGYSLGATLATAMLANRPSDMKISKLGLLEPVDKRPEAALIARFILSGMRNPRYLEENFSDYPTQELLPSNIPTHLAYLSALAKVSPEDYIQDILRDVPMTRIIRPEVTIGFGDKSLMTSRRGVEALAGFTSVMGSPTEVVEFRNEGHAFINSLPRYAAAVAEILEPHTT